MGRIINPSEIKEQSSTIIKSLQVENDNLLTVLKILTDFIGEQQLSGDAWTSQKNRIIVHIDIIKYIILLNYSIINDSRFLYINTGNEELYEDELIDIIDSCQFQIRNLIYQIESYNDKLKNPIYEELFGNYTQSLISMYKSIIYNYEIIISEASKKLEKIDEIEANLNNLFNDYQKFINIIKEVSNSITSMDNSNISLFSIINIGSSFIINNFFNLINNQIKEEDNFKKNIMEQFGFNEETTTIMWDVYESLKIKYPNASQKEIDWRFTRLMGDLFMMIPISKHFRYWMKLV